MVGVKNLVFKNVKINGKEYTGPPATQPSARAGGAVNDAPLVPNACFEPAGCTNLIAYENHPIRLRWKNSTRPMAR